MLTEIEERLVRILQERVEEIPKENIVLNIEPTKLPAAAISNLGFEFERLGLADNVDEGRIEFEESFGSDGVQTSYKLKEKPLQGSVRVECPLGASLAEKRDFVVNYDKDSIDFRKAPPEGENKIFVRYLSQKSAMTVKGLKVKATYAIDVWDAESAKADSLAEKVVKGLLTAEDELADEGIGLTPVGGEPLREQEGEKTERIRLKYVFERELRVKKLVPPIEKIEIKSKDF
jgi:hypothetical protein